MIVKVYDEVKRGWVFLEKITSAVKFSHKYKLQKKKVVGNAVLYQAEGIGLTKNQTCRKLFLNRIYIDLRSKSDRPFNVASIDFEEGNPVVIGFADGFLMNDEGKTIERL